MRTKSLILTATVVLLATSVMAQTVEYDDMYFNSKDRQKLREKQAKDQASSATPSSRHNKSNAPSQVYADNSTSYSARNQNPEFTARSNSKEAAAEEDYFSSTYSYSNSSYSNAANLSNFNNCYGSWYNSPWVANNYFGSSIYDWNSSYYGTYYDTWGSPWMNPYYGSGWSTSFAFYGGGSQYNYGNMGMGMGMSMGMSYTFGNPYNNAWTGWGYPSSYAGYGYGGGGYGGGSGYAPYVVDNTQNYTYGKRGTQNGMVTRRQSVSRPTATPTTASSNGTVSSAPTYNNQGATGGRMAATSSTSAPSRSQSLRQEDYYNRNWRTSRQADVYGGSNNSYSSPSRSSQNNTWNNTSSQTQQTQWNRPSSVDTGRSGYSGGNTGGAAPASSGTTGRTRVRD